MVDYYPLTIHSNFESYPGDSDFSYNNSISYMIQETGDYYVEFLVGEGYYDTCEVSILDGNLDPTLPADDDGIDTDDSEGSDDTNASDDDSQTGDENNSQNPNDDESNEGDEENGGIPAYPLYFMCIIGVCAIIIIKSRIKSKIQT